MDVVTIAASLLLIGVEKKKMFYFRLKMDIFHFLTNIIGYFPFFYYCQQNKLWIFNFLFLQNIELFQFIGSINISGNHQGTLGMNTKRMNRNKINFWE